MIRRTVLLMVPAVASWQAPASAQKPSPGPANPSIRSEQARLAFPGSAQRGGGPVSERTHKDGFVDWHILELQGYTVVISPAGADDGVDIVAGKGCWRHGVA